MDEKTPLFTEFKASSKADWLAKVQQDLKGAAPDSLSWQLSDTLSISPFAHPDDQPSFNEPLSDDRAQNNWAIGEEISLARPDARAANQLALKALSGGADALRFIFPASVRLADILLPELLQGIHLSMISLHLLFEQPVAEVIRFGDSLLACVQQSDQQPQELHGSVGWRGDSFGQHNPQDIFAVLQQLRQSLPGLCTLRLDGNPFFGKTAQIPQELAACLQLAQPVVELFQKEKEPFSIGLGISLGTDYLAEIAKIRALKILWAHMLKAYQLEQLFLSIDAQPALQSLKEDVHTNMIQLPTQALSAVIGGAQTLYLSVLEEENTAFSRRIARNVQHLLKMESYLDRVIDPAAGSYYLENLTKELATAAWRLFVEKQNA